MSVGSVLGGGIIQTASYSDPSAIPGGSPYLPADGYRYIVKAGGMGGAWNGYDNYIARYNAPAMMTPFWDFEFPVNGLQQHVLDGNTVLQWGSPDATSSAATGWLEASTVRASLFPSLSLSDLDSLAVVVGVLELDLLNDPRLALSSGHTVLAAPLVRFRGGVFNLTGSGRLTIQAIDAGSYQCFAPATAGSNLAEIVDSTSVNVRWYGAKGDGVADDTIALQNAIYCANKFATVGGEVYVPSGIYAVTSQLIATPLNATQGFAMRGDGPRSSILQSQLGVPMGSMPGGTMLYVGSSDGKKYDGVSIADMGFQSFYQPAMMGNPAVFAQETILVDLDFNRDAMVDRCTFIGGYNIQLFVQSPQGQQISHCEFFGLSNLINMGTPGTACGIYITNDPGSHPGQALRINNCIIRDFRNADGTAIGVNFTTGSEMAVVDCDIENNNCSVSVDAGRIEIARNSFESGLVNAAVGYPAGNASTANMGNGFIEPDLFVPVGTGASLGVYTVTCTLATLYPPAYVFTVKDPSSTTVGTLTVTNASASFADQIFFTIYPGTVPFVVNDAFTVTVLNVPVATASACTGAGNGALTLDLATPVISGAMLGTYTVTCTATTPHYLFNVVDPLGAGAGTYQISPSAFAQGIMFTIMNGSNLFHVNDYFTVTVTGLTTFAPSSFAPSVAANPGVANFGNGTITAVGVDATLPPLSAGIYTATCTTAVTGGGTFTVTDPQGVTVGSPVSTGTAFANQVDFTINAGSNDFHVGDRFQINALGDVMVKLGRNTLAASIICADNTMSGDAVTNQRFFDLYSYREVFIDRNVFITLMAQDIGHAVWLSPVNAFRDSFLRWNSGAFNPRTNIWFDPALPDGAWHIYGNSEGGASNTGSATAPNGSTAPLVTNLDTLYFENTGATTVTAFQRGYDGQMLSVYSNDGALLTTLQSGPDIVMMSGGDEVLYGGTAYEFRASLPPGAAGPVWQQIGPSYYPMDPDAQAYLNAPGSMVPPLPVPLQRAVNRLVLGLKGAGLWTTLDGLWLTAVNDVQLALVNLRSPGTYDLTQMPLPSGTLAFTAYQGIASMSGSYASTGMTRNMLTNYTAASGALSVWQIVTTNHATSAIGTSAGGAARVIPYQSLNRLNGRLNDNASFMLPTSGLGVPGLSTISRTSATVRTGYRNTIEQMTDNQTDNSYSGDTFYLLNDGGTVHTETIALAAIGAGRTQAQEQAFYNAVLNYMEPLFLA